MQNEAPIISEVLDGYLRTEHARLATRTYARDAEVISLLQQSLNIDGVNDLTPEDHQRIHSRAADIERGDPPYCEALGPYYLLIHLPTFLTAAQLRRLGAGPGLLDQAATVVKKLARWLKTQGYIDAVAAMGAKNLVADMARRSDAMDELARRLDAITQDVAILDDDVRGYFEITHIDPESIWVRDRMIVYGPVPLPVEIHDLCRVGLVISGTVGRRGNAYRFVEVQNVFP